MAKRIIFVFSGTGCKAQADYDFLEHYDYEKDVIRVYFNGCQDRSISGASPGIGQINPNLDHAGKNIRSAFTEDGQLDFVELKRIFGKTIIVSHALVETVAVEDITMMGYSRGAVTTFAVARFLDDLNIPMYIHCDEPVPGNSKSWSKHQRSEYRKNMDLRPYTHIKQATILIGAHAEPVNILKKNFYLQMAPLFSPECACSVYLTTRADHFTNHQGVINNQLHFLYSNQLVRNLVIHGIHDDSRFFLPKSTQERHHTGVLGRLTMLPEYKQFLFATVREKSHLYLSDPNPSFKVVQALYALSFSLDTLDTTSLILKVLDDSTATGVAIREFIVEFENINQHVFGNHKDDEVVESVLCNYRAFVYNQLLAFSMEQASFVEKQDFANRLLTMLRENKENLPLKLYKSYFALLSAFLQENCIFHLDLTQYYDETETVQYPPTTVTHDEEAFITPETASTSQAMAAYLFHASSNTRKHVYSKHKEHIDRVITKAEDLGIILRFLPAAHIESLLKNREKATLVTHKSQFNEIMEKLFTEEQRMAFNKCMRPYMANMELSVARPTQDVAPLSIFSRSNPTFSDTLHMLSCKI